MRKLVRFCMLPELFLGAPTRLRCGCAVWSVLPYFARFVATVKNADLGAFHTFVRFVLVWICRFLLDLGVWEGLRFVIVALPGLFSYLFCIVNICLMFDYML